VLVLGWYGTETIGDLAILSGIVCDYRRFQPGSVFVVPSHNPAYTRHNLARVGLDLVVTSYGDPALLGDLWGCDTVIVGGGPLMDVPQILMLAAVFERAAALGRRTVVEGCGIGPVNQAVTRRAIARIMASADAVRLRDAGSARLLEQIGIRRDVEVVDDPGRRWVTSTGVRHHTSGHGPICVFARELTWEYPQDTSPEVATRHLATFIQNLCDWFPGRSIRLHAMHHFPVGGDDRRYARRLMTLIERSSCSMDPVPRTPLETVNLIAAAAFVVCMRFHSVVFADAIGAPFMAIDYTDGGKVAHYCRERGFDHRRVAVGHLPGVDRDRLLALAVPEAVQPAA
jgi:polysaccharide pyruvyl transferase WcaK-like protein